METRAQVLEDVLSFLRLHVEAVPIRNESMQTGT
jgi:hypothetical protein